MDFSTWPTQRGPRLNNVKLVTVKERLMLKNQQLKRAKLRSGFTKKDIAGYYFDGEKSYTIYHYENRSYMLQDK
jgi:hypothetical protein